MPTFNQSHNDKLTAEIAADSIIAQNTRWGRLPLIMTSDDGSRFEIVFSEGRIADWTAQDDRDAVRIDGTSAQWAHILNGLHGGFHRAWRYRLLSFSGDQVRMMTFWKTIWRVGAALQKTSKEKA